MTSLKQTVSSFLEVLNKIEDGEFDDSILPELSAQESSVQQKVDSYVNFVEFTQAQIQKQSELKKKVEENIRALKNLEERLKFNAKFVLESNNLLEISGEYRKIKLQSAGGQLAISHPEEMFENVKIVNPDFVGHFPLDACEKKTVFVIDSLKFKQLVKDGFVHNCNEEERKKVVKFV